MSKTLRFLSKITIVFLFNSILVSVSTVIFNKIMSLVFDENSVRGLSYLYFLFALGASCIIIYNAFKKDNEL